MSEESKQSLFERFAKLIVPVAATVGVFFQQKQRTVALSLVALAVISLLVGEVPKLRARLRERGARKNEEKAATLALDELKVGFKNSLNSPLRKLLTRSMASFLVGYVNRTSHISSRYTFHRYSCSLISLEYSQLVQMSASRAVRFSNSP